MAEFANAFAGQAINYATAEYLTLAVSRGDKGFFAMGDLDRDFDMGLSDGEYCDIISKCQQKITVKQFTNTFIQFNFSVITF